MLRSYSKSNLVEDPQEDYTFHTTRNRFIWSSLSFQAGLINAGGFLACHRFVTHTTGFATQFGADLALFKFDEALSMLLVPLFFLSGAMLSAYFVDRRIHQNDRPKYYVVFALMTLFLFTVIVLSLAGFFGKFGEQLSVWADFTMIALLCLTSGLQNATLSTASHNKIRTTHLTGITTDLGIGIVRHFYAKNDLEVQKNKMRAIIIFAFILGSAIGAFLFMHLEYWGFTLPLAITTYLYFMARKEWLSHD